jgi:RNA polymerase sigma-70 factor (ECF subfamily)
LLGRQGYDRLPGVDHNPKWLFIPEAKIQRPVPVVSAGMQALQGVLPPLLPSFGVACADRGSRWLRGGEVMPDNGDRDSGHAGAAAEARQWIRAIALHGDRAAFAALFRFYAPRIKAVLMRAGATAETAEDVAQDTLVAVWRKAGQYDPARASAAAWIYTVARNLRIDRLRRDQREKLVAVYETIASEEPERPDQVLDSSEQDAQLRNALGELPEEQVRVVQLSFLEGRAHGEIAKMLGLPLGTVKSRLRLAMNRLRNVLGDPI